MAKLKLFHVEHFRGGCLWGISLIAGWMQIYQLKPLRGAKKVGKMTLVEMLSQGALELGVELDTVALERFTTYLVELKAWSGRMNLTTITEEREIVIRHFLDSLTPYGLLSELGCKSLLDIGAGAGFPGIPLKIAIPALDLLLIDSVTKKVHFMRHIIRRLGIKSPGIRAVAARGEDPAVVEKFTGVDCVISRAFSSIKDFLAMAAPYCRKNGHLVAMKGPGFKEELARTTLPAGISPPQIIDVKVPFSDRITTIISFTRLD